MCVSVYAYGWSVFLIDGFRMDLYGVRPQGPVTRVYTVACGRDPANFFAFGVLYKLARSFRHNFLGKPITKLMLNFS